MRSERDARSCGVSAAKPMSLRNCRRTIDAFRARAAGQNWATRWGLPVVLSCHASLTRNAMRASYWHDGRRCQSWNRSKIHPQRIRLRHRQCGQREYTTRSGGLSRVKPYTANRPRTPHQLQMRRLHASVGGVNDVGLNIRRLSCRSRHPNLNPHRSQAGLKSQAILLRMAVSGCSASA